MQTKLLEELLQIGHVSGSHGWKGEIMISLPFVSSNHEEKHHFAALIKGQMLWMIENKKTHFSGLAQQVRPHKTGFIIQLDGVNRVQQTIALKGKKVFVDKKLLSSYSKEFLYLCEVQGFKVHDQSRGVLGKVCSFLSHGVHDFLVVQKNHIQIEIPFIDRFVVRTDFVSKTLFVDLPPLWPHLDDQ